MFNFPQNLSHSTDTRTQALKKMLAESSEMALNFFLKREKLTVIEKSSRDYVSEADKEVEKFIRSQIKVTFPEDQVIGEEFGGNSKNDFWIIDPIDGTSNFLSGFPLWGVSIAYIKNEEPVIGGIAIPVLKQLIVADCLKPYEESLQDQITTPAIFGVGRNGRWNEKKRHAVEDSVEEAGYNLVSLGSCSVSLAFCASGNLAGYIESGIGLWDCAAGVIICKAAGMEVSFGSLKKPGKSFVYTVRKKDSKVLKKLIPDLIPENF